MIKKIIRSSLFRSSGIYTLANIINASIPFFLIPILTKHLSPSDYGMVSMFMIMISFVGPFIGLSIHGSISRKYFSDEKNNFSRYVGNCFYILIASTILVSFFFLLLKTSLSNYLSIPSNWLYAVLAISFFQFILLALLTILQVKVKPIYYGSLQISHTALNFILTILLVVKSDYGWRGRIEAQLIAVTIFALISFIILRKNKWINFEFSKIDIQNALRFSLPLVPHALGGLLIGITDRLFISNMVGLNATGIYTVAFQIGSVINIVATSFITAYVPWLYDKLNQNNFDVKLQIVKFTYLLFLGILILPIIAMLILPRFLSVFIDQSYVGVGNYAIWIILGYCFNSMYLLVTGFIFYAEKTQYLAIITFSTALVNIPVCYFFVKFNGAIGASQATAIVYFASFIFTWLLSNKVYYMPWFNFKKNEDII